MTICIMADSYICRHLHSCNLNYHVEVYADPDNDVCDVVAWIEDNGNDDENLSIDILHRVNAKIPELAFDRKCNVCGLFGAPEVHPGLIQTIYGRRNADLFMIHLGDAFIVVDHELRG